MTEIEKTKKEIEVLTAKLELLKEMEKHKTPCEIAYKRVYGRYPNDEVDDYGTYYDSTWNNFRNGYEEAQTDYKVGEYQPKEKEQKWDVIRESVKWCEEHPNESVEDYLTPQGPICAQGIQGLVVPGPGPKGVTVGYEPTSQTPEQVDAGLREAFREYERFIDNVL